MVWGSHSQLLSETDPFIFRAPKTMVGEKIKSLKPALLSAQAELGNLCPLQGASPTFLQGASPLLQGIPSHSCKEYHQTPTESTPGYL